MQSACSEAGAFEVPQGLGQLPVMFSTLCIGGLLTYGQSYIHGVLCVHTRPSMSLGPWICKEWTCVYSVVVTVTVDMNDSVTQTQSTLTVI